MWSTTSRPDAQAEREGAEKGKVHAQASGLVGRYEVSADWEEQWQ